MKLNQFLNIVLICFTFALLTSCAKRPYFAIANKSANEIKIELELDTQTFNLKSIVTKHILNKESNDYACSDNRKCDSMRIVRNIELDSKTLNKFVYDSLCLSDFFVAEDRVNYYFLDRIELQENETNHKILNNTLLQYYLNDSTLIRKLLNENILTLFVPSDNMFAFECRSCGDCSCDIEEESFPLSKELRVVIAADNIVTITKKNFKTIMKKKTIWRQPDSYVIEIE